VDSITINDIVNIINHINFSAKLLDICNKNLNNHFNIKGFNDSKNLG
jgi:hypothetical protein